VVARRPQPRSGRPRALTEELARSHPGAAASLGENLEETLTVTRLGVRGRLKRTLASTNPCEPMIETVRRISRKRKRWQNGDMCLRCTAAGMLETEQPTTSTHMPITPRLPRSRLHPPEIFTNRTAAKFDGERDILGATAGTTSWTN
jgi:transposase-like protein